MDKKDIIEVFGNSNSLELLEIIIGLEGYSFETVEAIDDGKWKATIKMG